MSERMVQITEARFVELVKAEERLASASLDSDGAVWRTPIIHASELAMLKADAEKWRTRPAESLTVDQSGQFSIHGFEIKDAQLGALVRRMPRTMSLVHSSNSDKWICVPTSQAERFAGVDKGLFISDTPEEALRAALEPVKP